MRDKRRWKVKGGEPIMYDGLVSWSDYSRAYFFRQRSAMNNPFSLNHSAFESTEVVPSVTWDEGAEGIQALKRPECLPGSRRRKSRKTQPNKINFSPSSPSHSSLSRHHLIINSDLTANKASRLRQCKAISDNPLLPIRSTPRHLCNCMQAP